MSELKLVRKPLLPLGMVYDQQLNCKSCGKNTYDPDRTVNATVVRSPCDDPIICDWCDYKTEDMRHMGLHVQHYHKEHPAFMESWLKIHEDGIDFEWATNVLSSEEKPRSPIP